MPGRALPSPVARRTGVRPTPGSQSSPSASWSASREPPPRLRGLPTLPGRRRQRRTPTRRDPHHPPRLPQRRREILVEPQRSPTLPAYHRRLAPRPVHSPPPLRRRRRVRRRSLPEPRLRKGRRPPRSQTTPHREILDSQTVIPELVRYRTNTTPNLTQSPQSHP